MRKKCPLNREEGHPCSTALLRRAPSASQQLQAGKPCSPRISHFEGEDYSVTKKGAIPRPKLSGALLQYTGNQVEQWPWGTGTPLWMSCTPEGPEPKLGSRSGSPSGTRGLV